MTGWVLIMTLVFTNTPWSEPLKLEGTRVHEHLRDCMKAGEATANWLAQDLVKVKWDCRRVGEAKEGL